MRCVVTIKESNSDVLRAETSIKHNLEGATVGPWELDPRHNLDFLKSLLFHAEKFHNTDYRPHILLNSWCEVALR